MGGSKGSQGGVSLGEEMLDQEHSNIRDDISAAADVSGYQCFSPAVKQFSAPRQVGQ